MSYNILYRSMFVKLSDGRYIPMMEMGDNNVWECSYGRGKQKRVRSWSNINLYKGQKFFTKDEVKKCLDNWKGEVDKKIEEYRNRDDEWCRNAAEKANFGFFDAIAVYGKGGTWGTSWNDVKNIIMGGFKNCLSFEDAVKNCHLHISYWEKENPNDGMFACQKTKFFDTEDEMFAFINEKFGDKLDWHFVYKDYSADKEYKFRKAVIGFTKQNGNKCRRFKVVTLVDGQRKYLGVKDSVLTLVDSIEDAMWLTKWKSNDVDICDLMYRLFPNIEGGMRCLYENDVEKFRA